MGSLVQYGAIEGPPLTVEEQKELLLKMVKEVNRNAKKLYKGRPDHEDLAQTTFLKVWSILDEVRVFPSRNHFRKWVYKIQANLFISSRRRKKNQDHLDIADFDVASPARQENQVWLGEIDEAMSDLTPREQRMLQLSLRLDSMADIAEALQVTIPCVKAGLHIARKELYARAQGGKRRRRVAKPKPFAKYAEHH